MIRFKYSKIFVFWGRRIKITTLEFNSNISNKMSIITTQ